MSAGGANYANSLKKIIFCAFKCLFFAKIKKKLQKYLEKLVTNAFKKNKVYVEDLDK